MWDYVGHMRSSSAKPTLRNEQGPAITALSSLNLPMESGPSLVIMDHDNSSKEENGHQFAVRFFPRARHKPNLATRDKKHVREVAVVKPHDLTTVRNFLVDMILREQKFQQKTLVCSYI
ncbi:hypothetical protein Y032_0044g1010 [Ancylostoma ceylanicum]|uniref:Uncharacterized protein n=2 Tax=Ancylostoma ceylanicum TaxID=53326 RepID=A0A016UE90_9BILA|nr:hypothetical protein Y032_0044g1010 [Ancylostoma ceylanicum]